VPQVPESPSASGFVDLHAHTNESDGSVAPAELVMLAKKVDLATLAITDHDTLSGYEKALPFARQVNLDLVCGIELNTKMDASAGSEGRTAHLLAYFFEGPPSGEFREWLTDQQNARRIRNRKLVESLRNRGFEITLAEVEARGRSLAGRPHFARILVDKGYARNSQDAFDRFIGEQAPCFVERQSISTEKAIQIVRHSHGIPVLAHPIRLGFSRQDEKTALVHFKNAGLVGLEIYHSEHPPELQAHYRQLAAELSFLPTGGSDFHGDPKPDIQLGTGLNGNVRVPREFVDRLRAFAT
jgi:predicted metal-dependent phosphoesterase TrpH